MKKLFISQPMNGKTDEEILAVRAEAVALAKDHYGEDIEVLDSFIQDAPHDANPLWYLSKALEKLSEADIAFFANGWEHMRGCRIEHDCAVEYGIGVIMEQRGKNCIYIIRDEKKG